MTPHDPTLATSATAPSRSAIIRDVVAVVLTLATIALPWDLMTRGSDHWYVVLASLLAALAPAVSHTARAGGFGAGWDVGFNRLIRYALVAPWLVCFVVLVVADLFASSPEFGYYDGYGGLDGGIGVGATVGLIGVLIAIQPRLHERVTPDATAEDRAWLGVAQALAGLTLAAYVATALFQQVWDAGFLTVVLLAQATATFVVLALPMIGTIRRSAPWILTASTLTALFVAITVVTIGNDAVSAGLGIGTLSNGETAHSIGYGFTYFAAAATAATAPRGAGLMDDAFNPGNLRPAGARFLLMLSVIAGVAAITAISFLAQGYTDTRIVVALFLAVVSATATGLGAMELWNPGRVVMATIGAGTYVAATWLSAFVTASASFVGLVVPALLGLIVVGLALGPSTVTEWLGSRVRGFAINENTGSASAAMPPRDTLGAPDVAARQQAPTAAASPVAPSLPPLPPMPSVPLDPADVLLSEASATETPLERLAEIAANHPEARAAVAGNPSTYPALLEWLAALQDPEVSAALARRTTA